MQQLNFQNQSPKQALIMKGDFRFKIKSCYHSGMITLFKSMKGRFYDQATFEWSFPNIELACILEFLRVNEFNIKVIDNEFLARLFRNETEIQMSFDTYQKDFSIFSKIEGAHYDRDMSKYIIPIEKLEELEGILISNKYNYIITEDKRANLTFTTAEIIELESPLETVAIINEIPSLEDFIEEENKVKKCIQ